MRYAAIAAISAAAFALSAPHAEAQALAAQDYITAAGIGDRFEIESSQLALQRSKDAEIRKFAQRMIKDHGDTTTTLKEIVAIEPAKHWQLPAALDAKHADTLKQLQAASAADFDKLYVQDQIAGHQEALKLNRDYAAGGDFPGLKAFAAKVASKVQQHLDMIEGIDGKNPS